MREVFVTFLRLGTSSFGGPVAHLAYFRRALVEQRRWLDEASYARIVAFCSVLPGPTSSQVGMLCGLLRAGPAGALAAWLGFTLPSAAAMGLLGAALGHGGAAGSPRWLGGLLDGLFAAAAGVVALAVWGLARSLCTDLPTRALAVACGAAALALAQHPGYQWVPIAAGALAGAAALRGSLPAHPLPLRVPPAAARAAALLLAGFVALALVPHAGPVRSLMATLVRAGTLVFGGGHVILPLLQSLVREGLIGQREFFAGYGAAQAMPGPLNSFAAYVGEANRSPLHGAAGAAVALVLVFAPSFALLFALAPVWNRLAAHPRAGGALRGANAAVVGLLAAVLIDPILSSLWGSWLRLALAAVALAALLRLRAAPWLVVGCAAAAGALAACAPARPPAGGPGTTLVVAQQREPASLNPALENGASSVEWGELLFQFLVKYDDRGRLVGDAAASVPSLANGGISRDGRTIVYHLRRGLRWADGEPLTARDCAWTIAAMNDPRNSVQSRFGYEEIAAARARDDTTLELRLRRPFAPLLVSVLAPQGAPILPQHLLARSGSFDRLPFNSMPLGSGPFVVTQWKRGERVELRANPYYYRGKPRIGHLSIRFVPDWRTAINLLRTREIDAIFNETDISDYPLLAALPGVRTSLTPVGAIGALIFNTRDPVVADARVRRAIARGIDIPTLVRKTYHGALDSRGAARGLFLWAYDPRAYPDVPYDPAGARALLEAAGWRAGPDGIRRKNGSRLEVQLVIQAAANDDAVLANAIAQYERAIGVQIAVKSYAVAQLVAPAAQGGPIYGGKFGLAIYGFVNGDDPDTTDQFACARIPPHGFNKSRLCDPAVDALLAHGHSVYDPAARKAIYARLQRILARELPIVPLYQRRELDAWAQRLRGQTTSQDFAWWNAGAWSL